jgi:diaminopimelate epimerase
MAKLTNYQASDVATGIERFEGENFCVIVNNNDSDRKVSVWERGYQESLYCGPCFDAASKATSLDTFEWFALLNSQPENVKVAG